MELGLHGRRALITGASRGIGVAVAEALAAEGCHIRLAARDANALSVVATRISMNYRVECSIHPVDLRNPSDLRWLAGEASDVDVLVNNAGDIPAGTLQEIDASAWRHAWDLKVFGYIDLTRLIYSRMAERRRGVVLNIIGAAGETLDPNYIAGATGNAALIAFTKTLGGISTRDGVRVVGVNPGPVETERLISRFRTKALEQFGDENRLGDMLRQLPLGRAATPQEIANMVVFLVSDRSAYTSGVCVTIDGGRRAGVR